MHYTAVILTWLMRGISQQKVVPTAFRDRATFSGLVVTIVVGGFTALTYFKSGDLADAALSNQAVLMILAVGAGLLVWWTLSANSGGSQAVSRLEARIEHLEHMRNEERLALYEQIRELQKAVGPEGTTELMRRRLRQEEIRHLAWRQRPAKRSVR